MGGVEYEFGVAFPGQIRPQEHWTQTALKRWPSAGPLDWEALFGRSAARVLDLGCGNGRFLIGSALARPGVDHLGVDALPVVVRYATRRANQRGLTNLRFAVGDARQVLEQRIAPGSLDELHVYHPQPYYDPRQVGRRLISPAFLALAHAALRPGGLLVLQTDNPGYWRYMLEVVAPFFDFRPRETTWPEAPHGRTRREILARQRGLPIFRGQGTPRPRLDAAQALELAQRLPPPVFDADRRLRALDSAEREPG